LAQGLKNLLVSPEIPQPLMLLSPLPHMRSPFWLRGRIGFYGGSQEQGGGRSKEGVIDRDTNGLKNHSRLCRLKTSNKCL
jgi:hypothetical protein